MGSPALGQLHRPQGPADFHAAGFASLAIDGLAEIGDRPGALGVAGNQIEDRSLNLLIALETVVTRDIFFECYPEPFAQAIRALRRVNPAACSRDR